MEDGLDTLGAEDMTVGFDYGSILQAAGGLATAGVSAAEQSKKEDADKAAADKQANAVIAADAAAARAMAQADFSAGMKQASASVDAQAAQIAVSAQDNAAAGLSADGQKKRADAADKALADAVSSAQAKPTDKYLTALVKAWTTVANKAHSGAITGGDSSGGGKGKGGKSGLDDYGKQSWWTKPVVGKLPGYGVVIVGTGVLGAVGLALKKFVFKR